MLLLAEFDLPILLRRAEDAGYPQLRHARYLDTCLLAKELLPAHGAGGPDNCKLPTLYKHFTGTEPVGNHRAALDCEFNREVLVHLLRRMQLPGGRPLGGSTVGRPTRNGVAK